MAFQTQTPYTAIGSIGLLTHCFDGSCDTEGSVLANADALGKPKLLAKAFELCGNLNISDLRDVIIVHPNGTVETSAIREDFLTGPSVIAVVRCEPGQMAKAFYVNAHIAVCDKAKIADICVYDPTSTTSEELLEQISKKLFAWLRTLLGDGYGLRVEVYSDRHTPPEFKVESCSGGLCKYWLLLSFFMKTIMPHIRMLDVQSALRTECLANEVCMRDLLLSVLKTLVFQNKS